MPSNAYYGTIRCIGGIRYTAPALLADDLRAGTVAILDVIDLPLRENEVCVITRPGRTRSPAASAVIEIVADLLAEIAVAERALLPE